jgi:hypothetical protein
MKLTTITVYFIFEVDLFRSLKMKKFSPALITSSGILLTKLTLSINSTKKYFGVHSLIPAHRLVSWHLLEKMWLTLMFSFNDKLLVVNTLQCYVSFLLVLPLTLMVIVIVVRLTTLSNFGDLMKKPYWWLDH